MITNLTLDAILGAVRTDGRFAFTTEMADVVAAGRDLKHFDELSAAYKAHSTNSFAFLTGKVNDVQLKFTGDYYTVAEAAKILDVSETDMAQFVGSNLNLFPQNSGKIFLYPFNIPHIASHFVQSTVAQKLVDSFLAYMNSTRVIGVIKAGRILLEEELKRSPAPIILEPKPEQITEVVRALETTVATTVNANPLQTRLPGKPEIKPVYASVKELAGIKNISIPNMSAAVQYLGKGARKIQFERIGEGKIGSPYRYLITPEASEKLEMNFPQIYQVINGEPLVEVKPLELKLADGGKVTIYDKQKYTRGHTAALLPAVNDYFRESRLTVAISALILDGEIDGQVLFDEFSPLTFALFLTNKVVDEIKTTSMRNVELGHLRGQLVPANEKFGDFIKTTRLTEIPYIQAPSYFDLVSRVKTVYPELINYSTKSPRKDQTDPGARKTDESAVQLFDRLVAEFRERKLLPESDRNLEKMLKAGVLKRDRASEVEQSFQNYRLAMDGYELFSIVKIVDENNVSWSRLKTECLEPMTQPNGGLILRDIVRYMEIGTNRFEFYVVKKGRVPQVLAQVRRYCATNRGSKTQFG